MANSQKAWISPRVRSRRLNLPGSLLALPLLMVLPLGASAQSDSADTELLAHGENLFKPCSACHSVGPDAKNLYGPQLNGVLQRSPGTVDDYEYSAAYKGKVVAGMEWTDNNLHEFLRAPMQFVPGTKMAYPGVADEADRNALIAWLREIGEDGVLPKTADDEAADSGARKPVRPTVLAADVPLPEHGVLHLGRVALAEEVAAWDIDIRPDGQGLPPGEGSVERGTELYDAQCASCHGVFGEGEGRWPVLAGGQGTLTEERPEKTIGSYWPYLSTVFDYVRRAMPFGNARSLSDDDVYAITAYLLYLNDLVDDDFVLSSANFPEVSLPNVEAFFDDDRDSEPHYSGNLEPCMTDCKAEVEITMRAAVLDVTPDEDAAGDIQLSVD